ncbi:MAG: hypothetical protein KatS3mg051_0824 [Anaerolineae bacterium]|nr:MAG: hypothetical protein KatS3mg051_0824 [Anaerolineae bacterium]
MDEPLHASVMLTVVGRAPLLADPRLARTVCAALDDRAPDAPGRLWGYLLLPDSVRLVLGPCDQAALQRFIVEVKAETTARALPLIRRDEDADALDAVLRFNPVWGGALYRLWQAGFHCTWLHGMAQVRRALQQLDEMALRAGLVAAGDEWPYRRRFT